MNIQLRQQLTDSILLHEDPAHLVGKTVFDLGQAIRDLETLRTDALAGRHVYADRNELQRYAVRLLRLAALVAATQMEN